MTEPRHEHGIEQEPHLQSSGHKIDPSEAQADRVLDEERQRESDNDRVEHNVWEEPALSADLAGIPAESHLTYSLWLEAGIQNTTFLKSMEVTVLVALAAGPWGVLGALWTALQGAGLQGLGLLAMFVFGPVTEEVAKLAAAWWVIEKRPYLFKSVFQILFCAGCGGLAFAAIENLIYMYIYVPDHSEMFVLFRWTICVALHVCCSLVAGVGLVRVWDNAIRNRHRPKPALGIPWLVIAITGHGLYNLAMTIASKVGWLDFLD